MRFTRKGNMEKENSAIIPKLEAKFSNEKFGREKFEPHILLSKLGQKFSVENFDLKMNEKKKDSRNKHRCPNLGKIFLSKNFEDKKRKERNVNWGKFFWRKI